MKAFMYAVVFLLVSISASSTFSQQDRWHIISTFSDPNDEFFDPWFLNEKYGFITTQSRGTVWRTDDSAKTWTQATNDRLSYSFPGYIYNIFFNSPSHLYLCASDITPYQIFESTDSGKYWKKLCDAPNRDIYVHNGVLYVAGFSSKDNGVSWQPIQSTIHDFDFDDLAGNRDSCIDMGGANALPGTALDGGSFYTTDMGNTWKLSPVSQHGHDEEYAVSYRPIFFRSVGGGTGNIDSCFILRSTDGCANWEKLDTPSVPLRLAFGLDGAGCVVYVQRTFEDPYLWKVGKGVLRSTDLGDTWHNIDGPAGMWYNRISVTSGGAVCYANDNRGNLWKYVDSSMLLPTRNKLVLSSLELTDTLVTTLCDSTGASFSLAYSGCDHILMDDLSVEGLPIGDWHSYFNKGKAILDNRFDTASVVFTPHTSGVFPIDVRIRINRSDMLPEDTVVHLVLIVKPNPPVKIFTGNKVIDFGRQPLCIAKMVRDSFSLANTGCESLVVTSVKLEVLSGKQSDVTFTGSGSFFLSSSDTARIFTLGYMPSVVGVTSGRIIITTNAGNDTIFFTGEGLADELALSSRADPLQAVFCDSTEGFITLTNISCRSITIDSATLSAPLTFISSLLPYSLAPGDSVRLRVRYVPSSLIPGTSTLTSYQHTIAAGDTTHFDTVLLVRYSVTPGNAVIIREPAKFDFKELTICSKDSGGGYITNVGCGPVTVDNVSIFADADYTLGGSTSSILQRGDTLRYMVYLNPVSKGVRTGVVVLTTTHGGSTTLDSIPVTVRITDGTKFGLLSLNSLDFGTTTLCEERDSVVTISNTGCDTLRVSGVGVQGIGFSSNVTLPIIIPPGDSVTIPVTTKVDNSQGNISTGKITITSDADNQIEQIILSRGYTYPKSYSFHIAMLDGSATSGELVRLAIVGEQGLGSVGSGVNRLDFDLSLNEDLLEYIRPEGSNTVSKNGTRITISNPNELASTDDTLAILVYHVFLTKDSVTDITVTNISINNGDTSSCAPKIAAITQSGFTYRYECGDKHIQSFLRTGQASLEITSIRPNPAKDELTVEFLQNEKSSVSFEVYDMLGTLILQNEELYDQGRKNKTIGLRDLPSGSYVISLRSAKGVTSKRFTKEK
jgi:hypothetical protein